MNYEHPRVNEVAAALKSRMQKLENKADIVKAVELKALYAEIPTLPAEERAAFGKEINALRTELEQLAAEASDTQEAPQPIDVTAPFDMNVPADKRPRLLSADHGSRHPITTEIEAVADIFYRMGFEIVGSRQLDDDYHMFTSLNFPEDHPARDDYDTFMTVEKDKNGHPFIAPAHTSTMQNRLLSYYKPNLEQGRPIAL